MKPETLIQSLACFCAFSAVAPFATADLEKFLPAGETLAIAKIENAETAKNFLRDDALAREFRQKFGAPLREILQQVPPAEKDAVSHVFNTLCSTFSGEVVFAGLDSHTLVCIADYDKELTAETAGILLSLEWEKEARADSVSIGGVPAFKLDDSDVSAYAAKVGDKLVLAFEIKKGATPGVGALKKIFSSIKNGVPAGFSESAVFKRTRERIGEKADFWYYIDGAAVARTAYAVAEKYDRETMEENAGQGGSIFEGMLQARAIVAALAPEAIDAVWGQHSFDPALDYAFESGISWNEDKGLVSLATASAKPAGFEKPNLFPPADDLISFDAENFSLGKFLLSAMELVRKATPLSIIADMQIMQLKTKHGIDVPAALGALDYGFYSCRFAESSGGIVCVLDVSDEVLVKTTLEKSLKLSGATWEKTSLGGNEASVLLVGDPAYGVARVAFAISRGKLFVGSSAGVGRVLAHFDRPDSPSVWESPKFKEAEASLPAGGNGVGFSHLGGAILGWIDEARSANTKFADVPRFDIHAGDFDYFIISKSYCEGKDMILRARVIKNK